MSYAVVHRNGQTHMVELKRDDDVSQPEVDNLFHHRFKSPVGVSLHIGMGSRTINVIDIVAQDLDKEQFDVLKALIEGIERDVSKSNILNAVLLFPGVEVVLVGEQGELTVVVENQEGRRGWRSVDVQTTFILGPMADVLRHPLNSKISEAIPLQNLLDNLLANGVFGDGYKEAWTLKL